MYEAFVESSEVGDVLVFGKMEPDVEHEAIELNVEFDSEERHGE